MRIYDLLISLLCIFLGGLVSLTSAAMVFSILISQDTNSINLFWIGVISLLLAPPVFIAGLRILLNRPNRYGGILSPGTLRVLAVVNGIIGGLILVFALIESNIAGIYGGISFLATTQGAFVLANIRAKT